MVVLSAANVYQLDVSCDSGLQLPRGHAIRGGWLTPRIHRGGDVNSNASPNDLRVVVLSAEDGKTLSGESRKILARQRIEAALLLGRQSYFLRRNLPHI